MKKITGSLILDSFEHRSFDRELDLLTTEELLQRLSSAATIEDGPDGNTWDFDVINPITHILAQRLDYVLVDDLTKVLKTVLNEIITEHNEFKKNFENHRHNKEENYSGKPVW